MHSDADTLFSFMNRHIVPVEGVRKVSHMDWSNGFPEEVAPINGFVPARNCMIHCKLGSYLMTQVVLLIASGSRAHK